MSFCIGRVRRRAGANAIDSLTRAAGAALLAAAGLAACGGGGDAATRQEPLAAARAPAKKPAPAPVLSAKELLGKAIFFDKNLSANNNQSCATCHDPATGWTGPSEAINAGGAVYEGSIAGRFGDRKPPSSAYATQSPILYATKASGGAHFVGGNFWDGRATGWVLGLAAADQAQGPFLNPVEQALPSPADVVGRICSGNYAALFTGVWGPQACDLANIPAAFGNVALSVAAFEASPESNAFSSKFDFSRKGKAKLTQQEQKGFALFMGKGRCSRCHTAVPGKAGGALFTDYTFDNLGLPRNPDNPVYTKVGYDWVDPGLGDFLAATGYDASIADLNKGKFKVPTLRNVDMRPSESFVKAYGHNGYFKSLKGIVHFYNTRDVKPRCADPFTREADALLQGCWPAPEVEPNLNTTELGNLGLTDEQEDAIVAFLRTLSDGFQP